MRQDRIEIANCESEYIQLTFADKKAAKRASRVAYFEFEIEKDARLLSLSSLERVRGKLEANGIAWSESETGYTWKHVDDMRDNEPVNARTMKRAERRSALLEAESAELERDRWQNIYEEAGLKVVGESYHPAHHTLNELSSDGVMPEVGDLYVCWNAEVPDETNHSLRRVIDVGEHGWFELGPSIPRSEWPVELRVETLPVTLRVEHGEPARIALIDGQGKPAFTYVDRGESGGWYERRDKIVDTIKRAVRSGLEDAKAGRQRDIAIQKDGRSGLSDGRSWWAVGDAAGIITLVEPRIPFSVRPTHLAEAVLGAARAGYAEGRREALEIKAAQEAGPAALGM